MKSVFQFRPQYKLRSLLLVVTLLCAIMAIVANSRFDSYKHKCAWERIISLGGKVARSDLIHSERGFLWRNICGTDDYVNINAIWLEHSQLSDADLSLISNLPHIELLVATDTNLSDQGLKYIRGLNEMKRLYIGNTQVTDSGISHLSGMTTLRSLQVDGTAITNRALSDIASFPNIEELGLENTQITDDGLGVLIDCKSLKELYLAGSKVTTHGIDKLQIRRPDLIISANK